MLYDIVSIMNIEKLNEKVSKLLEDTEDKMTDLIEKYNESNEDENEIDAVDLSGKFSELSDYIEDYSQ